MAGWGNVLGTNLCVVAGTTVRYFVKPHRFACAAAFGGSILIYTAALHVADSAQRPDEARDVGETARTGNQGASASNASAGAGNFHLAGVSLPASQRTRDGRRPQKNG